MPISAVVDASILVSAFLFPDSVHGRVLKLAKEGAFLMHLSPLLIDETRTALLSRRLQDAYGHDETAVTAWCADLAAAGHVFEGPLPEIGPACRDPNDDHVIATALAIGAEIIVTGDKDLLDLSRFQSIRILPARAFLMEVATRRDR
jgi:putative PIN family toxin of toxin-antitoxin system